MGLIFPRNILQSLIMVHFYTPKIYSKYRSVHFVKPLRLFSGQQ